MRKLTALMSICGCLGSFGAAARADAYRPRAGHPHPDFTLPSIADGEPISLSQFRGKKVLLLHFAS